MFRGCGQDAHLLKIAQYAGTLLEKRRQVSSPVASQNSRSRFNKDEQTSQVAATVGETQRQVSRSNIYSGRKQGDSSPLKNWNYNSDGKNQREMHCRLCLAQNHVNLSCPFTVRSSRLERLMVTNYREMTSTGPYNGGRSYAYNKDGYRDCKYHRTTGPSRPVSYREQASSSSRRFPLMAQKPAL